VLGDWSESDRAALAAMLERLTGTLDGYLRQS
jgi:hypothetical protein